MPGAVHAKRCWRITGAILAGGAGVRMGGCDKGLEMLGTQSLVARVTAALRPQVDSILIVANRNIEDYMRHAPTIRDEAAGFRGPLAGIAAALAALGADWLVSVPVDCVSPPVDLVRQLLGTVRMHAGCAAFAHDGARRQPLFAIYSRRLAQSARAASEAGTPVWRWQDEIDAIGVSFTDQGHHFANLNTPEDFAAFERSRDGGS